MMHGKSKWPKINIRLGGVIQGLLRWLIWKIRISLITSIMNENIYKPKIVRKCVSAMRSEVNLSCLMCKVELLTLWDWELSLSWKVLMVTRYELVGHNLSFPNQYSYPFLLILKWRCGTPFSFHSEHNAHNFPLALAAISSVSES